MGQLKRTAIKVFKRGFFLTIGSLLTATGLELFLIPNKIIDGGIIGISILANYLTNLPIGIFILCLNLPFLFIAYNYIGLTFVVSTLYSVSALAIFTTLFHPVPSVTGDLLLASVFGGIILGAGGRYGLAFCRVSGWYRNCGIDLRPKDWFFSRRSGDVF